MLFGKIVYIISDQWIDKFDSLNQHGMMVYRFIIHEPTQSSTLPN